MNGVEAAASLFGPEELASDPFAALGGSQSSCEDPDPFLVNGTSFSSSATSPHSNSINDVNTATPPLSQEYAQQELHSQNSSYSVGGLSVGSAGQQGWHSETAYHTPEPALNGSILPTLIFSY